MATTATRNDERSAPLSMADCGEVHLVPVSRAQREAFDHAARQLEDNRERPSLRDLAAARELRHVSDLWTATPARSSTARIMELLAAAVRSRKAEALDVSDIPTTKV